MTRDIEGRRVFIFHKLTFAFFVGLMFGAFMASPIDCTIYNGSYERGQIDALTGHVHYRLVTLPDSTKEWREVK